MARGFEQKESKQFRKRSESLFRQISSADRENRPALTGYKPLKKDEPSFKEALRLENSRGTLAFGGNEKKEPTLIVTEKHHPGGPAAGERERSLEELGWRERPMGANRTFTNPGKGEDGAFGFQLQTSMTRTQMMEQMKNYMGHRRQQELERMMPFLVTERDLREKKLLEEEVCLGRRENAGRQPQAADRLLEEKKQELVQKKQMEARFGQELEKAAVEEKKTVWKLEENPAAGIRRLLQAAVDEKPDREDEGQSDENQPGKEKNRGEENGAES